MKTRIVNAFFALSFMVTVLSCTKDKSSSDQMSADQAKVEIRAGAQLITAELNTLMSLPAVVTLQYLSTLTSNGSLKSAFKAALVKPHNFNARMLKDLLLKTPRTKSSQVDFLNNPGTYQFSFQLNTFELISPSATMIKLIFPANEQAYNNQLLNAEFLADNLQITDSIPTNADLSLMIDQVEVMTGTYISTISNTGVPTSVTLSMLMNPYKLNMTFSGSGLDYTSIMSLKLNNQEILGFNEALRYTADMQTVEKVTGILAAPPLSFNGWLNAQALQIAMADSVRKLDVAYLNTQMSMAVFQTVLNQQIGTLAFMLFTDPDTGKKSPSIAVVYSDGSWEWLAAILNSTGGKSLILRSKKVR